jgi:hypothetical protein
MAGNSRWQSCADQVAFEKPGVLTRSSAIVEIVRHADEGVRAHSESTVDCRFSDLIETEVVIPLNLSGTRWHD